MAEVTSPPPPMRPRVPRRKPNPEQVGIKKALVDSFSSFCSSTVSDAHLTCALDCIQRGGGANIRYQLIPFTEILKKNEVMSFEMFGWEWVSMLECLSYRRGRTT